MAGSGALKRSWRRFRRRPAGVQAVALVLVIAVVAGAVYVPMRGELFTAVRGEGEVRAGDERGAGHVEEAEVAVLDAEGREPEGRTAVDFVADQRQAQMPEMRADLTGASGQGAAFKQQVP